MVNVEFNIPGITDKNGNEEYWRSIREGDIKMLFTDELGQVHEIHDPILKKQIQESLNKNLPYK